MEPEFENGELLSFRYWASAVGFVPIIGLSAVGFVPIIGLRAVGFVPIIGLRAVGFVPFIGLRAVGLVPIILTYPLLETEMAWESSYDGRDQNWGDDAGY